MTLVFHDPHHQGMLTMNAENKEGAVPTPRTDGLMQNLEAMDALFPANAMFAHAQQLERELAEAIARAESSERGERAADSEVERLTKRLSETVRDCARLDWLQLHREDLSITRDLRPDNETIYVDCSVTGVMGYGQTLRAAIDAAMKAEAPK